MIYQYLINIDKYLSVTIKRVKDGFISNYHNDYLKEGDAVPANLARSQFRFQPKKRDLNQLVLIAAGSGITPILSILKTALYGDSKLEVVLIFGNRNDRPLQALMNNTGTEITISIHLVSSNKS